MLSQGVDDAADASVYLLDHSGVDSHAYVFVLLVLDVAPGRRVFVSRRDWLFVVNDAHGALGFVSRGADGIPALHVLAFVVCDVVFPRVQWPVWGSESDVLEEWLVGRNCGLYLLDSVVGDGIGQMEVVCFDIDEFVLKHEGFRVPVGVGGF